MEAGGPLANGSYYTGLNHKLVSASIPNANPLAIDKSKKRAMARQKTGPGVGLRVEGFFVLIFCYFWINPKVVAHAAMSGTKLLIKTKTLLLRNEATLITVPIPPYNSQSPTTNSGDLLSLQCGYP